MSTRGMYSFTTGNETHHVYRHSDNYPTGAARAIAAALPFAWPLPRFEPDEFGCAFIAGNKGHSGNLRLMESGDWRSVAPHDLEYRYEISCPHPDYLSNAGKAQAPTLLRVRAWTIEHVGATRWVRQSDENYREEPTPAGERGWHETMIFDGTLAEFPAAAKVYEAQDAAE